jgi:alkylhydroperoxidase family enzyme
VSSLASGLAGRDRAALRWADGLLVHPDDIEADLRAEVGRYFSPAELMELSHSIARFASGSKMRILFGLTPPIEPGTVT